jgi:hypothetical protein
LRLGDAQGQPYQRKDHAAAKAKTAVKLNGRRVRLGLGDFGIRFFEF